MSLTEECLKANQYDQVEGESASQFFFWFLSLNKQNPFTLRFGSLNVYKTKAKDKEVQNKNKMQERGGKDTAEPFCNSYLWRRIKVSGKE